MNSLHDLRSVAPESAFGAAGLTSANPTRHLNTNPRPMLRSRKRVASDRGWVSKHCPEVLKTNRGFSAAHSYRSLDCTVT